jgi:hypothetical protein
VRRLDAPDIEPAPEKSEANPLRVLAIAFERFLNACRLALAFEAEGAKIAFAARRERGDLDTLPAFKRTEFDTVS